MNRHLTNDELLNRLYGLGEAEGESTLHLRECTGCAERWRAFERRRAETAAWPDLSGDASNEFLAAQRRSIYARLEERSGGIHVRWAPAVAAGFLLAVGVYLSIPGPGRHVVPQPANAAYTSTHNRPAPVAHVVHAEMSDEQLFSDVYSMEQSAEPRAAVPLHALFTAAGDEEQ
jgi:hypothetical protein